MGVAGLGWAAWRRKSDESGFSDDCREWSILVGIVCDEKGERGIRFGIDGRKERRLSGWSNEDDVSDLGSRGGMAQSRYVCFNPENRNRCAVEGRSLLLPAAALRRSVAVTSLETS